MMRGGGDAIHFPSFSEGLSLRDECLALTFHRVLISLPFRRDFH